MNATNSSEEGVSGCTMNASQEWLWASDPYAKGELHKEGIEFEALSVLGAHLLSDSLSREPGMG